MLSNKSRLARPPHLMMSSKIKHLGCRRAGRMRTCSWDMCTLWTVESPIRLYVRWSAGKIVKVPESYGQTTPVRLTSLCAWSSSQATQTWLSSCTWTRKSCFASKANSFLESSHLLNCVTKLTKEVTQESYQTLSALLRATKRRISSAFCCRMKMAHLRWP